ncbi:hypothetical protein BGZ65_002684 [Modicella reniformis]|uniref:EamA domain-containing protein n=1 Tax=Modicella reniformis TaxID=1440133 RepID=A0A9P6IP41_9FUNG|nr:hypothetical protein BGZ65_002684 [Modicella reniformis]
MTIYQETSALLPGYSTSSRSYVLPSATNQQPEDATPHQETKGLIYMALSAFFFSSMSLLVSLTAKILPSFEVLLFRGIIQTILGIATCRYLGISPWGKPEVRFLLFCRGLAGTCALGLFFFSLSIMPLADATVIFFLGPVFTAILARIIMKEPFGPLDALASVVTMCGVVLVAKPSVLFPQSPGNNNTLGDEDGRRLLGALCAACGATGTATAYVLVRKIGKEAHPMQHVVALGLVACLFSPIGLYTLQGGFIVPQGALMWSGVISLGVAAFLGQILLNNGQMAPLGPGTLMRMNDIVFAFIFQITIQHQHPDVFSYIGATLVMLCTGSMGLNKWRLEKKRTEQEKLQSDQQARP